jgi:hypothetical protein
VTSVRLWSNSREVSGAIHLVHRPTETRDGPTYAIDARPTSPSRAGLIGSQASRRSGWPSSCDRRAGPWSLSLSESSGREGSDRVDAELNAIDRVGLSTVDLHLRNDHHVVAANAKFRATRARLIST